MKKKYRMQSKSGIMMTSCLFDLVPGILFKMPIVWFDISWVWTPFSLDKCICLLFFCHDGIERKTEMLRQNFPTMCKIMYRIKHLNITKILSSSTNHNFRNFWQHMFCLTSSHLSLQHSIKITSNEVWKPQRNNWDSTTHGRYDDEPPPQKCCNLDL